MKPEDIKISDWQRIFIGDVPGGFYLEVILRVFIIYLLLMVSMRLMGKRMASQLSRSEMIAMVSLAAAIGIPLQSPDRGIIPAIAIAIVVVSIQQLVAWLATKNQKLESLTQGNVTVLVEDHHLNLESMKVTGITRERVFSQLRHNDIRHLGEIKRLYFEAGGSFSLIREVDAEPGLGILPECDMEYQRSVYREHAEFVCGRCGYQARNQANGETCSNCGNNEWMKAVSLR